MAKQNIQQINGSRGGTFRNLFASGASTSDGFVAFNPATTLADLTSDVRALAWEGTTVKKWNGTTWATLDGGGGVSSWDDLYASDKTLTISGTTLTFSLTHATNDGLTITGSAGSAGQCLQITNSGSGDDIQGTSDTWAVTAAGAATFVSIDGCDSLTAAANLVLEATGAGTISVGATSTGAIDIGTGGGAVTLASAVTCSSSLTVATGITNSDGLVDLIDNSNAASTLRVTNDTQSTYGNASDAGMIVFRSESITTGALLHLSLDETNLAGGSFLRCWSQDLGSAAFTIGEYGVTTIAGPAAGGSAALTITAGDVAFSDGSLGITDADNAASLTVTNDTATTIGAAADAGVVDIDSESLTTGALLNLSLDETALTTGWYLRCYGQDAAANVFSVGEFGATVITSTNATATPLTITADSATTVTGGLVSMSADALTTGVGILVASTSLGLAAGQLLNLDHTASGTITAAKTGQLVDIVSSRTHTAASAISDDYDAVSIIRTGVVNNAGGELNSAGSCLYILNTATQTSGTMADTVNGVEISMQGGAEAQGNGLKITHSGTTVGQAIDVVASQTTGTVALLTMNSLTTTGVGLSLTNTGTGMTSGSVLRVASGTTGAVATNGIVSFSATGAFTSTSNAGFVSVIGNSTTAGTVASISGTALTTGVGLYVASSGTGMTSGSLIRAVSGTTGAVATNGLLSVQATGAYTSTSNMGILSAIANSTTAGTVAYISGTSMVGGTLLFLNATAATLTGKYIQCYDGAADDFSVGQYGATIIAGNAAGTAALTLTAGDIALSAGKISSTTTADIYGLDVTVNKATATQGVAVFTNSSATSGKSVLELEQADLDQPYIKVSGATAITSATAGANGDVPAQVVGYLNIDVDGTPRRVPYYAA